MVTLTFIGVVVSGLVQYLKNALKLNRAGALVLIALLCLLASAGYTLLTKFGYWEAFWSIVVTAGAFYAYVIKTVEGALTDK